MFYYSLYHMKIRLTYPRHDIEDIRIDLEKEK